MKKIRENINFTNISSRCVDAHKKELAEDWELAKNFEPLEKIQGTDND